MENDKLQYFENPESPKHQAYIDAQNNCALCGTVLELKHDKDNEGSQIKEEARCPECEIRTRAKIYSVH